LKCCSFVLKCTLIAAERSKEAGSGFLALITHHSKIPKIYPGCYVIFSKDQLEGLVFGGSG